MSALICHTTVQDVPFVGNGNLWQHLPAMLDAKWAKIVASSNLKAGGVNTYIRKVGCNRVALILHPNKSNDMDIVHHSLHNCVKSRTFSRWKSLQKEVLFWCRKLQFWSTGREFSPFDVWRIANIPPSDLPLKSRADVKKALRNPSSSFWSMIVWKYRLTAILKIAFAT